MVLLVEDEAIVARSQARLIRELGATVCIARDTCTAREHLHSHTWDGVVVDVRLPDGSGFTLLEQIRATQPLTPVLVQSAMPDQALPGRAFLLDAHFVYKPCGEQELRAFIERVRGRARRHRERYVAVLARIVTKQDLTEAERDVLTQALDGRSYQEIAKCRATSVNTVKTQVRSLLQKTGARSLPHLTSVVVAELMKDDGG